MDLSGGDQAPDETDVCLAVSGDDLDPDEITRLMGCEPTRSRRRGDRMKSGAPWRNGLWYVSVRGTAEPEELAVGLLDRLPTAERFWTDLAQRCRVTLRFGLFMNGRTWDLGFSPKVIARIAGLHAMVILNIYGPDTKVDPREPS